MVGERDWVLESEDAESFASAEEEVSSAIEALVSVVLDMFAMLAEAVFGGYFLKKVRSRGGKERASSMCCWLMCETAMVADCGCDLRCDWRDGY